MTIQAQVPPPLTGQPNVPLFKKESFDALIWNKGYEVILEQAIACPCRGKSGSNQVTCQNCLGLGWVFVNPLQTRAIVSSINYSTKYKNWSPELTGTISVTLMDENRVSYFDKITFKSRMSVLSEIRSLQQHEDLHYICFTSYRIKKINNIFIYTSPTTKLVKIPVEQYSIKDDRNIIDFTEDFTLPTNGVISIDYEHELSYNIYDIPHDLRSTFLINDQGKNQEYNLPIQAIARKTHLIFGESFKYNGEKLNNDY